MTTLLQKTADPFEKQKIRLHALRILPENVHFKIFLFSTHPTGSLQNYLHLVCQENPLSHPFHFKLQEISFKKECLANVILMQNSISINCSFQQVIISCCQIIPYLCCISYLLSIF